MSDGRGVGVVGAALVAGLAGGAVGGLMARAPASVGGPAPAAVDRRPSVAPPAGFAEVAARALPAVVHVRLLDPPPERPVLLDPLGGEGEARPRLAEGSGFVIDGQGLVVTSRHLLGGSTRALVRFADRGEAIARLAGEDAITDLALLRVDRSGLPVLRFGDSTRLRVGDWVGVLGHPLRFEDSFTVGVLSSRGRKLFDRSFDAYLQTDAAINPGNSGGPLLDATGAVVGVVAAVSGRGQGLGFAVPSDVAAPVIEQLRRAGRVARGYLGAQLRDVDPDLAALLKLPAARGAVVVDVAPGGPAEAAGLRAWDVVTELDGTPAADADALVAAIASRPPGAAVDLQLWRDGRATPARASLAERPAPIVRPRPASPPPALLGLEVEAGTGAGRPGVVVRRVLRPAPGPDAIEPGDVVLEVDRANVPDVAAWRRAAARVAPGAAAFLYVHRPREGRRLLIKLRAWPEAGER
jgi:serine protease Do